MFDRDASTDDRSRPSKISDETRATCCALMKPWPLAHHQLTRRSIESYVPAKTIGEWWPEQVSSQKEKQRRRRRAEAFLRRQQDGGLRREARHSFNFKKGLGGDQNEPRQDLERAKQALTDEDLDPLFRGLHSDVREALTRGFPGLAEAFSTEGAIQEDAFRREVDASERAQLLASLFSRL